MPGATDSYSPTTPPLTPAPTPQNRRKLLYTCCTILDWVLNSFRRYNSFCVTDSHFAVLPTREKLLQTCYIIRDWIFSSFKRDHCFLVDVLIFAVLSDNGEITAYVLHNS